MIMSLGPHAVFIVAAYAISTAVVVALIVWVIADYRRQRATLRELEAGGIVRRSAHRMDAAS
jgi:heme exporter protein D